MLPRQVAVVALVVAPMLLIRPFQMCDCELRNVVSGAVDWVCFAEDAFEREFAYMEGKIWLGVGGEGGVVERVQVPGAGRVFLLYTLGRVPRRYTPLPERIGAGV